MPKKPKTATYGGRVAKPVAKPLIPLYRGDDEPRPFFQSPWKPLLVVLAVALLARVIQFFFIRANDPSFDVVLKGIDSNTYNEWAKRILAGDWASRDQPVFYYGPVYPYFLAAIYRVFGESFAKVHLIQFALGILTSGLVYLGAAQWFSRRVALGAGLLMALCPGVLFYESMLLPEAISFLAIAAFICLLGLAQNHPQRLYVWFAMGLSLGLAVVQRANTLLCVAGVALWVLVYFAPWKWGRKALVFAIFLVGVGLPLVPTLLHNRILGHQWVLVTSNGPNLFYIGNAHDADGTFAYCPSFTQLQEEEETRQVSMTAELRRDIAEHPGAWVKLMAKKIYLFWAAFDPPDNFSYDLMGRFSPLTHVNPFGFALIVPLAFVGMGVAARRWRHVIALYAFVATFCASIVLVFVVGRYRLHVISGLCGFAALGVAYAVECVCSKRYSKVIVLTGIVIVTMIVLGSYAAVDFRIRPNDYCMLSRYYRESGQTRESIAALARGEHYYTSVKPNGIPEERTQKVALLLIRRPLAQMLIEENQYAGAERVLQDLVDSGHSGPDDYQDLVGVLMAQGKQRDAVELLQALVKAAPKDPRWQEMLDQVQAAR